MKTLCTPFLTLLLTALLLGACKQEGSHKALAKDLRTGLSPLDRLPDNEAGTVVRKAIARAGGWENWANVKTISFTKVIQHYDTTGRLEKEERQLHQYQLQPLKIRMSWQQDGDQYVIINNGMESRKLKNGKQLTEETEVNNAYNSSFGSHYVLCMPFKLTDPGTILTYEGLDTLASGQVVHAVKTTYRKGAGSAGGMHTWRYYFDKDNYDLAASFLDHGQGYSYTHYNTFRNIKGIRMHYERKSYPADATRSIKYVRTVYKNENVQFNVALEDKLFEQE